MRWNPYVNNRPKMRMNIGFNLPQDTQGSLRKSFFNDLIPMPFTGLYNFSQKRDVRAVTIFRRKEIIN